MRRELISIILLLISFNGFTQTVTSVYPELGSDYFPILIEGTGLSSVSSVSFTGGDAICFSVNYSGTKINALAPPGVKSGPISVVIGEIEILTTDFTVIEGASPIIDFQDRDTIPQTDVHPDDWCYINSWGPPRRENYPEAPEAPEGVDKKLWRQARIIGAALKWRYLPYEHHHIPDFDGRLCQNLDIDKQVGPGLDCSNFTSWIYLYAFNHHFTSAIVAQSESEEAGRLLSYGEALEPGDLLFSRGSPSGTSVTHAMMYIDPHHRIDETSGFCDIRSWGTTGWPYTSFHCARRPLDLITTTSTGEEIFGDNRICIYPNPAANIITVSGLLNKDRISIISLSGLTLIETFHNSGNKERNIDISLLVPGNYYLVVIGEETICCTQFIKQN